MYGLSNSLGGVVGFSIDKEGVGGLSFHGVGVHGYSNYYKAMFGETNSGVGVHGESTSGGTGVFGRAINGGEGVGGVSDRGIAVYTYSTDYIGIYGSTESDLGYAAYLEPIPKIDRHIA